MITGQNKKQEPSISFLIPHEDWSHRDRQFKKSTSTTEIISTLQPLPTVRTWPSDHAVTEDWTHWGRDSSVVRAADSKLKVCGLETQQENFLLQGQLSVVFQDCPQTCSSTVLMNLVFCASVSLMPALCLCFLVRGVGGGGGRTAEHPLGLWACLTVGAVSWVRQTNTTQAGTQSAVGKLEAGGKYACSKLIRRWVWADHVTQSWIW